LVTSSIQPIMLYRKGTTFLYGTVAVRKSLCRS
jgi:hypothetical protein